MEILLNGKWGTICNDDWDINDARVACRQLGYKYAVSVLQRSHVPDGSGQIWLSNVRCTGSEQSLIDCPHSGRRDIYYCRLGEYAGVECSTGKFNVESYIYCSSGNIFHDKINYIRYNILKLSRMKVIILAAYQIPPWASPFPWSVLVKS